MAPPAARPMGPLGLGGFSPGPCGPGGPCGPCGPGKGASKGGERWVVDEFSFTFLGIEETFSAYGLFILIEGFWVPPIPDDFRTYVASKSGMYNMDQNLLTYDL